jgi:hypothetical protein
MLLNVLPDITAASPAARAVFAGIMLSGVGLLGRYATALWVAARQRAHALAPFGMIPVEEVPKASR